MKRGLLAACLVLLAAPVPAREGFSVGVGLGGGIWDLPRSSLDKALAKIGRNDGVRMAETLSDGLAVRFAMAYNILGWTSIELGMTGHGWNLSGGGIGGSGHVSMVAHFHPLQIWLPERNYDASVFLGGGFSIVGGGHPDDSLDRGMDGGMLECGFTGRYFFTPWFSLGADFRFSVPFYTRWVVDWDDEDYSFKSSPDALFFSILVMSGFHFQTPG